MSEMEVLFKNARTALEEFEKFSQEEVDHLVKTIGITMHQHAEELAELGVKETGMGNAQDKAFAIQSTAAGIWEEVYNKPSVGVIDQDEDSNIYTLARPKGVIGAILPSTVATLNIVGCAMLILKGRNTMIASPHPAAVETTKETIRIINEALKEEGAPDNLIQMISDPSNEATNALMTESDVIIATGGAGLVKAAYSSGTPAYGSGPGNAQVIVAPDYDDYDYVAKQTVDGKSFDNGTVCSAEQMIIVPNERKEEMMEALNRNQGYVANSEEKEKIIEAVFEDGHVKRDMIAKTAQEIAEAAGLEVANDVKAFILEADGYGEGEILAQEKLLPVLGIIGYDSFEEGVEIARTNTLYEGGGHTSTTYTEDLKNVEYTADRVPVGRMVWNVTSLAVTGSGLTTHIPPTMSIGCGAIGNNAISENLRYDHLIDTATIAGLRHDPAPSVEEIFSK